MSNGPHLNGMRFDNTGRLSKAWILYFVFLFLYRVGYSIFGQLVVLRLTPISDTENYQKGIFEQEAGGFWQRFEFFTGGSWTDSQLATGLTAKLGALFGQLLFEDPILVNIAFQTVTFVGLVYLLLSLERTNRVLMAGVVLLPSFTLWTSIASKESIVAFCVAILSGYLVRMYLYGQRIGFIHVLVAGILFVYKSQYLIAFTFVVVGCFVTRSIRQKAVVALLGGLFSLVLLYMFRDDVAELSGRVQWALTVGGIGQTTRFETFFVEKYDVFLRAPEGMFLAFFGPVLTEVFYGPLQSIVFIESSVLLLVLVYLAGRQIRNLPVHSFILGLFSIFWILFPNYPFGVYNPGTAIRYRSGWIVFLFVVFILLFSRDAYDQWMTRRRSRIAGITRIKFTGIFSGHS
jgi:hypothetical protein